jgi:hypothetical protein
MNDQHAQGPATGRLLIFVGPAAIIGHGLAAEIALSAFKIRVVDQDDEKLAPYVLTFEIIPVALGCRDPIAHEQQRRVLKCDQLLAVERRPQRNLVALQQRERLAIPEIERELRVAHDVRLEERHVLEPAALSTPDVACRPKSHRPELIGNIVDRLGFGAGRRPASFKCIRGYRAVDVREALGADAARG